MRFPTACYQIEEAIGQRLPHLRPAERTGLALWVYGTILAQSCCQHAVITALLTVGKWHALRQRLREVLWDGSDKAAPCRSEIEVGLCFVHLLRWVLAWWQGSQIALAVDATALGERVVVLTVSVLYQGNAIPVAWQVLPANQAGGWMRHILRLLRQLRSAIPPQMTVLVLADRGLWSPRLWKRTRDLGWHPLLRVQEDVLFQPVGQRRRPARQLAPGPGYAWVGQGVAFKHRSVRRRGTLLVVWLTGQAAPWIVLTDLPPKQVGVCWYGLRMWVELGFRALKGVGWQWQHTRRTDPSRVARHWLVLALAMLWVLAYGTRAEDAQQQGLPPGRLLQPPTQQRPYHPKVSRQVSIFRLGLAWLRQQLGVGRIWRRLWLMPDPWPEPPPELLITYHEAA